MAFDGHIEQSYAALTTWVCAKRINFSVPSVNGGGDRVNVPSFEAALIDNRSEDRFGSIRDRLEAGGSFSHVRYTLKAEAISERKWLPGGAAAGRCHALGRD
jgi:hypothetical protein